MVPREKTAREGTRLSKEHQDIFPNPLVAWADIKVGLITVPQDEKLKE